ncbi:cell surface protein SprA [Bacteroidales bacterium OttesenSCG-928-I21]|nr:cell surface protein SprA [Bacteroidales bacterium OttesenSCG-928-I21]
MKVDIKKILLVVLCGICIYSTFAIVDENSESVPQEKKGSGEEEEEDLIFPISKKEARFIDEKEAPVPVDLKDPDNIKSTVEYDPQTGHYVFRTKVGDEDISTPYVLNSDEYKEYSMQKSMQDYWRQKTAAEQSGRGDSEFSLTDIHLDIGKADQIFGPGGIQVKTQGAVELSFGFRKNKIDNPTLTERSRNPPPTFDFDEKIQLSVNGSVGDKINLAMNYNTEASFDFDQKMIKLAYEGKEDEIIQRLEAGNVSMPLSGTLITGNSSLFGIRTQLKFGRLTVDGVVSQQESDRKSVSMKNGSQTTPFEIYADEYDENRHFFLSHYFYDNYDKGMSTLPYINTPIKINRVEVWVTNKRGNYEQNRNIVAFADLGEPVKKNPHWISSGERYPANRSNNLYSTLTSAEFEGVRDLVGVNELLDSKLKQYDIEGGEDYDKIESARLLSTSEYTINYQLGYISLKSALNSDEVLAVAFEFTANGTTYQVGEFSTDNVGTAQNLLLKMLKGTNLSPPSPNKKDWGGTWNLMMKNVYSIGGYQIQQDKFELNIMYQSDSTGVYLNYIPNIPASPIDKKTLLSVMNLDRLDSHNESRPDGFFDFVEGYTIQSSTGKIIFPVVEPFGSHLKKKLANDVYDKYVYQELYDSTLVVAQEFSEKNKFKMTGKYKGSSGSEIRLNAMNVPRGSVTVTAGGRQLTENVEYTVDYTMGVVNIIDTDLIDSGTTINVSLEDKSYFSTQRKTLLGTHLDYKFNENFNIGGTLMHLSEKPLTQKVTMGSEPISNTIWGLNTSYHTESQWLTNVLDKIPLLNLTAPSSIAFNAEFAQLIPGHSKVIDNYAYIDDFETTKTGIDIRYPQNWKLASTPALFPEYKESNKIEYGQNRALLAWYTIDPIFTRNSNNTPRHIRNDVDQLSNHYVREIREQEIFPNRETVYGQSSYLTILNLAYYPEERGPYNLDGEKIFYNDGKIKLKNPEQRWGGIMRKLETTDFETANIEYIEFWMMDPFIYNQTSSGGDLYFNLGDVSEDILKDGRKSFESGLPTDGDLSKVDSTVWGYVPKVQSIVYAFENDNRRAQDVGLNGLNSENEKRFGTYSDYLNRLERTLNLTGEQRNALESDPFSPLNDPAGDDYHYFRGSDYDSEQLGVLDRYKRYNGLEGNSPDSGDSPESYSTASTSLPDVEDINQDNTLNEYERYYQYKVSLRPEDLKVGAGYVVDRVEATVDLPNGNRESVNWYQFKIPVHEYDDKIGNVKNFKSIRFVRMFMTGFKEETHLRFGALELVRGEWRTYQKDIRYDISDAMSDGVLDVSAVNIEENSSKQPIRYILPPGVSRVVDPSQTQIRQENEQAMVLKITNLGANDARAVYKKSGMDMRQYKRLQMFVHAEELLNDDTNLKDDELTVFIRLGSDHTNNFYEYEIPLKLTPHGTYSPNVSGDAEKVWPNDNMFNFPFSKLTDLKLERNRMKDNGNSGVSLTTAFFKFDGNTANKITVMGNPSLSDVQVIMIGVRNRSNNRKSAEIWVNELRLSEFNEDGGYAALANLVVNLSDFGTISVSGRTESAGFGSIEQNVLGRNLDDTHQFDFSSGVELGRFFPEKAKVKIPFYYSYSREVINPQYNPLDQDILLSDALDNARTKADRDSIKSMSQDVTTNKSLSFSNVKVDIQSKRPQLYDPANFSFGYTYNETNFRDPETEYELTKNHRGILSYNYSTNPKPFEPFAKMKAFNSKSLKLIKDFNVNYMPSYISYVNNINRYYYEYQVRDLTGADNKLDPSFKQDFTWTRNFDIRYDFSRSLKFTLSTATNSRIDEPYTVVNKKLYPDEYEHWKDSVWSNIKKGGRAIQYQQIFTADYNVPLNKIPILNWMTLRGQYNSTYNWERGVITTTQGEDGVEETIDLGNTAINNRSWQVDSRLNFENLYKKSNYLNKINSRFSGRNTNKQPAQPKKFNQKISLKAGEKKEIKHRLGSGDIDMKFTDAEGKVIPVKTKKIDQNTISVTSKTDIEDLNLEVSTKSSSENPMTFITQGFMRMLMMVRNVSGTYKETNNLILPGFQPSTGFLGQDSYQGNKAPGYNFVFGFYKNDDYVRKAQDRNWLSSNEIGDPVVISKSTDLQLRASVEPIRSFKIELNAQRSTSETQSVQFYTDGQDPTRTYSGTFSMTQIAIGTSLWKIGKSGDFDSKAFNNFMAYRETMATRLEDKYISNGYSTNDGYNRNSADVLIPSFIAAYTNRKPGKTKLDIFPSLARLMPNWRITYNGLSNLEFVKQHLKSVNLTHAYRCVYNVGSYSSILNWEQGPSKDYGYAEDITNESGTGILSSRYDIGTVTITESFSPLLGIDVAMKNNLSFKLEYKRSRTLGLNIPSVQLIESSNNEWVVGSGYVIKNFDAILKIKQRQSTISNDLTLRADVSIKDIKSIIRKIEEEYSQPTSGSRALTLRVTADYVFSEKVNIILYYNRMTNTPFISSSYPTISTDFGVTFKFLLTR